MLILWTVVAEHSVLDWECVGVQCQSSVQALVSRLWIGLDWIEYGSFSIDRACVNGLV